MSKDLAMQENEIQAQQWDLHEVEEQKPLDFTGETKPDLFGIEPIKAQEIVSGLSTTLAEREILKNAYLDVIDLEINSETLPIFKELRLKIVRNRTQGIEKWHKTNKAFYLAGGRFVDAIKNKEIQENEQMESKLLEAEKYFENLEKEKARVLNDARIERIKPYVDDIIGLDFAPMTDEDFDDYLLGKKTRFENEANAKIEAEKKAEAERLAEIERQKAIEVENAKLKQEAEEKEKALEKERAEAKAKQEAIEAKAKQEAEKQAKIQAQKDAEIKRIAKGLQDKKDAEIKAENERLAQLEKERLAKIKAEKAPIKEQLSVWVNSFELPNKNIDNDLSKEIEAKFESFKKWSISQINNL